MARLIVNGGKRISGLHTAPGNKNAALPMLAACVLTDEPVQLCNLPRIDDVHTMLEILSELGASVELSGHTVTICAAGMRRRRLPAALCRQVRTSVLFAGPLAARHGRAVLFPPGGDVIGRRRLDTHFEGLKQLGIHVEGQQTYNFHRKNLRGANILLDEASVTATENVVMAAVLATGETILYNAACEPHVQDLCHMLNCMGACIRGIGTNRLEIKGVKLLHGTRHNIQPDYVDAASFLAAAAITGGSLTVANTTPEPFECIARTFRKLGIRWTHDGETLYMPAVRNLRVTNDFGGAVPKIEDGPWPNFPSDLLSIAIVVATQARGTVLFFEKMFESRMYFVDRLIAMGARIVQCDPHRVLVSGPASLHSVNVASPDIRAGMSMVLAALCAKKQSIISNAECIDRGYERLDVRLGALGADITRED